MARKRLGLLHLSPWVGAFALLPYLALREPNTEFSGKRIFLKLLDSLDWCCTDIGAVILPMAWGWEILSSSGKPAASSMSWAWIFLPIVSRALRGWYDASGFEKSQLFWLTALIPLLVPDLSGACHLYQQLMQRVPSASAPQIELTDRVWTEKLHYGAMGLILISCC